MVRLQKQLLGRVAFLAVGALMSLTSVAQAEEMTMQVKRTGPQVTHVVKARPTEIVILRGEARMRRESERLARAEARRHRAGRYVAGVR